jgi:hypothetical protein
VNTQDQTDSRKAASLTSRSARPRFNKASGYERAIGKAINGCPTHDAVTRRAYRILCREGDYLMFYGIWTRQIAKQECLPFSAVIVGHIRAETKGRVPSEWPDYVADLVRLYGLPEGPGTEDEDDEDTDDDDDDDHTRNTR